MITFLLISFLQLVRRNDCSFREYFPMFFDIRIHKSPIRKKILVDTILITNDSCAIRNEALLDTLWVPIDA